MQQADSLPQVSRSLARPHYESPSVHADPALPPIPTPPHASSHCSLILGIQGWEAKIDPRSGRKYYMDNINKKTTWTHPNEQVHPMLSLFENFTATFASLVLPPVQPSSTIASHRPQRIPLSITLPPITASRVHVTATSSGEPMLLQWRGQHNMPALVLPTSPPSVNTSGRNNSHVQFQFQLMVH